MKRALKQACPNALSHELGKPRDLTVSTGESKIWPNYRFLTAEWIHNVTQSTTLQSLGTGSPRITIFRRRMYCLLLFARIVIASLAIVFTASSSSRLTVFSLEGPEVILSMVEFFIQYTGRNIPYARYPFGRECGTFFHKTEYRQSETQNKLV